MQSPSEARVLALWEAAAERPALPRALILATAGGARQPEVADLGIGQRDAHLLAVREQCFGSAFSCVVDCPECGAELELELTVDDVRAEPAGQDRGSVTADDVDIAFRPITSRDLLGVAGLPDARRELIQRCVTSASRGGADVTTLTDPMLDAVSAAMSALDPQAGLSVEIDCAVCGHRWAAPFDVAEYLWSELNAQAVRILREVHDLATIYGWSEADVLAVSPTRRRRYLEMAAP
jgi:hypothetical protein